MLTVVHLEPEEFANTLYTKNLKVDARVYVLENNTAGIVYMTEDNEHLYYLDRFYPTIEKRDIIEHMDFYALHMELYCLINLDQRRREKKESVRFPVV
ncbi:MAG: hypothetical protein HUJ53_08460 [Holdemanella sp.]|nr:hypothetical protein [Holdemanella sp.]